MLEALYHAHEFHAVIGGVRETARQLLGMVAEFEDDAVAARPGVTRAGAIGIEEDFFHGRLKTVSTRKQGNAGYGRSRSACRWC